MPDPVYKLEEMPAYDEYIRALQDIDPARATTVFNPVLTKMLNNTHYVKKALDALKIVCYTKAEVDSSLSNKANWSDGFIETGSLTAWAESKTINTGISVGTAVTDVPASGYWMANVYIFPYGGWKLLTVANVLTFERFYSVKNLKNPWSAWIRLLTSTHLTEYNLPLSSGILDGGGGGRSKYWKTQDGEINFTISVSSSAGNSGYNVPVATLPAGYRPMGSMIYVASALQSDSSRFFGSFNITPDGTIAYFGTALTAGYILYGLGSFVAT